MDDDNFSEAFLKANANEPFIAAQFAEFIRNILRSTITSGYSNQKYAAVDNLKFCFALLRNAEQVHFLDLVDQIIEDLEVPDDRQRTDSFATLPRPWRYGCRAYVLPSELDAAVVCTGNRIQGGVVPNSTTL